MPQLGAVVPEGVRIGAMQYEVRVQDGREGGAAAPGQELSGGVCRFCVVLGLRQQRAAGGEIAPLTEG